jgi:hypothetical protein
MDNYFLLILSPFELGVDLNMDDGQKQQLICQMKQDLSTGRSDEMGVECHADKSPKIKLHSLLLARDSTKPRACEDGGRFGLQVRRTGLYCIGLL